MKKLIDFIKVKEGENNVPSPKKKANPKTKKNLPSSSRPEPLKETKDLFWDGYSDIGYC